LRVLILLFAASALSFAQSWSGYLVDAGCYRNDQSNHNENSSTVERDMNLELRQCSPTAKTRDFALVLRDWSSLKLDSSGNAKAAQVIRNSAKKTPVAVTVSGEQTVHTLKVSSISRTQ